MSKPAPRELSEVIDKMLPFIPKTHKSLRNKLRATRSSVIFAAPEVRITFWNEAADILAAELGFITEKAPEWIKDIMRIWMNDPDYKFFVRTE